MKGQQIIICPNCGSNKIRPLRPTSHYAFVCFILAIIPILGWMFFPFVLVWMILRMFKKTRKTVCNECGITIIVSREQYKEYINFLKGKNKYLNETPKAEKTTAPKTTEVPRIEISKTEILKNETRVTETPTQTETSIQTETPIDIQTDIQSETPTQTQTPNNHAITFNVAGVTFDNEEGKDIQTLLRRVAKAIAREKDIPAYAGMTNSEILEYYGEVSEFEDVEFGEYILFEKEPDNEYDKNAIKVVVKLEDKKHHIGYVPKKYNVQLNKLLDTDLITDITANFVGGKIKEVDYDFEKDKDVVVIKELTLGVEITVYYKDEKQGTA